MRKHKENRLAMRFLIVCEVELGESTGSTRDLSTSGFRFTTDQFIPLKSKLRCVILMPRRHGKIIRLRCEGQVVRVNKDSDGWEIAVKFSSFEW